MEKVLITGCSSGLGFNTCLALAKNGYQVVATVRKSSDIHSLKQAIIRENLEKNLQIEYFDIVEDLHEGKRSKELIEKYEGFEIVIFNAGILYSGLVEKLDIEDMEQLLKTNLLAQMALTKRVVERMKAQGKGKLIYLSSLAGRRGLPYLSAYNASKAGLEGFAETLYLELAPYGIETFLIEPGFYKTALWSHDKIYLDEDSKKMKKMSDFFVSSRNSKEVTFQILKICQNKRKQFRSVFGWSGFFQCLCKPFIYSKFGKRCYLWLFKRIN